MENVTVTINKPLYGTFVNIRDIYIKQAIRERVPLRIVIPQGEALVDPKEWIKTGKRVEQVFRIANKPMVLYGNYVPLTKEEAKKAPTQLKLL